MKDKILLVVLQNLLPVLLKMLTPDMVRAWVNSGLDVLESQIKASDNKIDDAALPIIGVIRAVVNG